MDGKSFLLAMRQPGSPPATVAPDSCALLVTRPYLFSFLTCRNVFQDWSILALSMVTRHTSMHVCAFPCGKKCYTRDSQSEVREILFFFNPLKPELNPICYLLALLGAHHFLHVSRIRVKSLTFRLLMSYIYIYGAPILDVSRSHTTTQHSR